jgi:two-component system sensor histidine kinase KdpD
MLRIVPQSQPLDKVIESAITQLKIIAAAHKLVWNVPLDLPPVCVDGLRIAQVLTNLVGNAARYAPEQTQITISAHDIEDMIQIDVMDRGPGIPRPDRGRIFEAFRQLGDETAGHRGGAGLGLAICKGLVEAHGGRIWVQDQSDSGTVISFTVPAAHTT